MEIQNKPFLIGRIKHPNTLMHEILEHLRYIEVLKKLFALSIASRIYLIQNLRRLSKNSDDVRQTIMEAKKDPSRIKYKSLSLSESLERHRFIFNTGQGHFIIGGGSHKIIVVDEKTNRFVGSIRLGTYVLCGTYHDNKVIIGDVNSRLMIYEYFKVPL